MAIDWFQRSFHAYAIMLVQAYSSTLALELMAGHRLDNSTRWCPVACHSCGAEERVSLASQDGVDMRGALAERVKVIHVSCEITKSGLRSSVSGQAARLGCAAALESVICRARRRCSK